MKLCLFGDGSVDQVSIPNRWILISSENLFSKYFSRTHVPGEQSLINFCIYPRNVMKVVRQGHYLLYYIFWKRPCGKKSCFVWIFLNEGFTPRNRNIVSGIFSYRRHVFWKAFILRLKSCQQQCCRSPIDVRTWITSTFVFGTLLSFLVLIHHDFVSITNREDLRSRHNSCMRFKYWSCYRIHLWNQFECWLKIEFPAIRMEVQK